MKYIKDKNLISVSYCRELREYILKNQNTFFLKENKAVSWTDFETWPDKVNTDRDHLILPKEVMLIDRMWGGYHSYCICTISKNRKAKDLMKVIEIRELDRNNWKNGYFLLPNLEEQK